jgi:hypothetical protein
MTYGSALGFIGVIITLLTNAALNRKQHTRQIDHERTALKAALSAELSIIRDSFDERIKMLCEAQEGRGMLVPLDTMTGVYNKVIEKLGLLSGDQGQSGVEAYLLVQAMPDRLRFFQDDTEIDPERNGYLRIASKHVGNVREMHENFLADINDAIGSRGCFVEPLSVNLK